MLQEKLVQLEAGATPSAQADSERPSGPFKPLVVAQPDAPVTEAPPVEKKTKKKKKTKLSKRDQAVAGARVSIYWVAMKEWFDGNITYVDPSDGSITVKYDDGDELTYPSGFKGYTWKLGNFKK